MIARLRCSYLVVDGDARNCGIETEHKTVALTVRICVSLHGVQIGRRENAFLVVRVIQNELSNATGVWIVVVGVLPNANIAVGTSRDDCSVNSFAKQPNYSYKYAALIVISCV